MTFLGGSLERMSWGAQACPGHWSDPALLCDLGPSPGGEFSRIFIPRGDLGTEDQRAEGWRDFYAGEAGGRVTQLGQSG